MKREKFHLEVMPLGGVIKTVEHGVGKSPEEPGKHRDIQAGKLEHSLWELSPEQLEDRERGQRKRNQLTDQ